MDESPPNHTQFIQIWSNIKMTNNPEWNIANSNKKRTQKQDLRKSSINAPGGLIYFKHIWGRGLIETRETYLI